MILALTWAVLLASPFERDDPKVAEGIGAYRSGHYLEALADFEDAAKRLPPNAALELDRGNALYQLGRYEEAKEAFRRAVQLDTSELKEADYYNVGNAWARMGQKEEAAAAYRRALTLSPGDEDARHNLEVVLRTPPPAPRDGGVPDGGSPDGGNGGQSSDRPDGGGGWDSDGGASDRGQGDGGQEDRSSDSADGGASQGSSDGGGEGEESVDGGEQTRLNRREAERILDSMRRNEGNLQLWRFQPKKPRRPREKDW